MKNKLNFLYILEGGIMDNSMVLSEILFLLMIIVSPFFIFLLAIILKKYRKKKSVIILLISFVLELFSVIFLFLLKVFSFLFVGDTKYVDDMTEEIDQYFYKDNDEKDKKIKP